MCRLSAIAVAISAASANMVAALVVSPSWSAILATLASDRAIRERSPIRRRTSRLSSKVSRRPLVLAERRHHPAEVVERDREHEVRLLPRAREDPFLAHGSHRPTIGRATGGLGPHGAEDGGGDRGRRGGSDLLRAREARPRVPTGRTRTTRTDRRAIHTPLARAERRTRTAGRPPRARGTLTDDEFQQAKQRVLSD